MATQMTKTIMAVSLHWFISLIFAISFTANASDSLVEKRIHDERTTSDQPFVLTPHNVNYILATYNDSPNIEPFREEAELRGYEPSLDNFEIKFQVSVKFPIMYNVFGDNGHLFMAYTNQSYWQINNTDASSPFRETNHEPEVFMMFNNDWKIAGLTNSLLGVGFVHQSNGSYSERSRSWNRIYGIAVLDKGSFALRGKIWWRIPEDEKEFEDAPQGDDNPDIDDYMGNFELTAAYALDEQRFTMILRNNLDKPNYGAMELTWSYPIKDNLRLYTQYFYGYGESMIDYNTQTQRIGIGFALNDIF
ncbi:putative outer membrane phospholipase A precursor [Moritella sp. PE36]|nr:putative outer membrane phospholipase A precursor [Moritella sp. PE36]